MSRRTWFYQVQHVPGSTSWSKSLNLFQVLVYADGLSKKISFMLNIIITMGKYNVHKSKWNNSKPSLNCFKNEYKIYFNL